MSGVAEGIAGLALSAISVAALFTTCIECFDIVIAGKNFSEDYEQLCALFSLQRARFGLWGESVGLIPNPANGRRLQYDKNIDRSDIKPGIERILNNIKSLLDEANKIDGRYGIHVEESQGFMLTNSKGLAIFKSSFDKWKKRIRRHQKQSSAWKVTRWAIHDAKEFEGMIGRLKDFVDGLESITRSLGLLHEQHARLLEEIENISDTQTLRLLRDASSRHGTSDCAVSDAASERLLAVAGGSDSTFSIASTSGIAPGSLHTNTAAPSTTQSLRIPGAWPKSITSHTRNKITHSVQGSKGIESVISTSKNNKSCMSCLEEHYKCIVSLGLSCTRCEQLSKACSFLNEPSTPSEAHHEPSLGPVFSEWSQNQRLSRELVWTSKARGPLIFAAGEVRYGDLLHPTKSEDEDHWVTNSGKFIATAGMGSLVAKRMFFELRNIRAARVPFISAVPLDDSLNQVLASIEGPLETPYEGGIFWITVKLLENDPFSTPLLRFHTKVYHPNISPEGHIRADYYSKWESVLSAVTAHRVGIRPSSLWYGTEATEPKWSLGDLLIALCKLLAMPDIDDPLVPEIAIKYLRDYEGYCHDARLHTRNYATWPRPEACELLFMEGELAAEQRSLQIKPRNELAGTFRENSSACVFQQQDYNLSVESSSLWNSGGQTQDNILRQQWIELFTKRLDRPMNNAEIDLELRTLSDLIQSSGNSYHAEAAFHGGNPSAMMLHSLLELSTMEDDDLDNKNLSNEFGSNLNHACAYVFKEVLRTHNIYVRWTESGEYLISISDSTGSHDCPWWQFIATWNRIDTLGRALVDNNGLPVWVLNNLPTWQSNSLSSYDLQDDQPEPTLGVVLLEYAIGSLFYVHLSLLLRSRSWIELLRPTKTVIPISDEQDITASILDTGNLAMVVRSCIPPQFFNIKLVALFSQEDILNAQVEKVQLCIEDGGEDIQDWALSMMYVGGRPCFIHFDEMTFMRLFAGNALSHSRNSRIQISVKRREEKLEIGKGPFSITNLKISDETAANWMPDPYAKVWQWQAPEQSHVSWFCEDKSEADKWYLIINMLRKLAKYKQF